MLLNYLSFHDDFLSRSHLSLPFRLFPAQPSNPFATTTTITYFHFKTMLLFVISPKPKILTKSANLGPRVRFREGRREDLSPIEHSLFSWAPLLSVTYVHLLQFRANLSIKYLKRARSSGLRKVSFTVRSESGDLSRRRDGRPCANI